MGKAFGERVLGFLNAGAVGQRVATTVAMVVAVIGGVAGASLALAQGAGDEAAGGAMSVAGASAGADAGAAAAIEWLHASLVDVAAEHGDAPLDDRVRALRPIVIATHDLPYIAELTIRREWAGLSEPQRARFVEAFVDLSVTTYASRFAGLQEGMFRANESREAAGGRYSVTATLVTDEREIPFEYVLHETESGWKIVNILADNVSDLALKRAEYRRVLDAGSVDELIDHLEQQQIALRSDRPIR